jgi:hypothetical protein
MHLPPPIPEALRDSVILETQGDHWVVTCRPSSAFIKQAKFITGLLPEEKTYDVGGIGSLESQLGELLGDMAVHTKPHFTAHSALVATIEPETGRCHVQVRGMVDEARRKRMGIKFSAAAALSPLQAQDRLGRLMDSAEHEDDKAAGAGFGQGLMLQRAYSQGPMELVFFPERAVHYRGKALQPFQLDIAMRQGKSAAITQPEYDGKLSTFFPRIKRN